MKLTKHAAERIIQRNKAVSNMSFNQMKSLIDAAEFIVEGVIKYILLKSIDLVLVLNTLNDNIVTAYNFSTSKFNA